MDVRNTNSTNGTHIRGSTTTNIRSYIAAFVYSYLEKHGFGMTLMMDYIVFAHIKNNSALRPLLWNIIYDNILLASHTSGYAKNFEDVKLLSSPDVETETIFIPSQNLL